MCKKRAANDKSAGGGNKNKVVFPAP